MRCPPFTIHSLCLALAFAPMAGAPPAMAQESAAQESASALPPAYRLPPEERTAWLTECHRRMFAARPAEPPRSSRREKGYEVYPADGCEAYLDNYYAYYAEDYARYLRKIQSSPTGTTPVPAATSN